MPEPNQTRGLLSFLFAASVVLGVVSVAVVIFSGPGPAAIVPAVAAITAFVIALLLAHSTGQG